MHSGGKNKMRKKKNTLNRRDFIKSLTVGGIAFVYGCSKDSPAPTEPTVTPLPNTQIALYKTTDRRKGVKKVLELLNYPSANNQKVYLKPNFNTADPPPASTHNDTLSQLIIELQNHGASEIILAERSFQAFDEVIQQKEIDSMALDMGFRILHLETGEKVHFNRQNLHWQNGFQICKEFYEAEYIVSTCCLKTHQHGGVFTISLKLSVGVLPSSYMGELHSSSSTIRDKIAEINLSYKPKVIVMDGIDAFINGGPASGQVKAGEVMVAGTDRIAIDAVGVAILKKLGSTVIPGKIWEQDQIKRGIELGLGIKGPGQIEFVTPDEASQEYSESLRSYLFDI
jgi:uncharacterized protein (DUF362 family)